MSILIETAISSPLCVVLPIALLFALVLFIYNLIGAMSATAPKQEEELIFDFAAYQSSQYSEGLSSELLEQPKEETALDRKLQDAGMKMKGSTWTLIRMLSSLGVAFIVGLIFMPVAGVAAGVLVYCAFPIHVKNKQKKRMQLLESQLAACEVQLAESSRAGLSIVHAVASVAEQTDQPLKSELIRLYNELMFSNMTLAQAFESMAVRTGSNDVKMLASVLSVQQDTGANLADTLEFLAETISARVRMRSELRSKLAEFNLTRNVVAVAPFVVAVLCSLTMDGWTEFYVSSPIGWLIIGLAVGLEVLGLALLARMSHIEFK